MVQPTNPIKNTTAPSDEYKQETKPGVGVESIENVGTKGEIDSDDEKNDVEGDWSVGQKVRVKKDSMLEEGTWVIDKIDMAKKSEPRYILKDVDSDKLYRDGEGVKEGELRKPKQAK